MPIRIKCFVMTVTKEAHRCLRASTSDHHNSRHHIKNRTAPDPHMIHTCWLKKLTALHGHITLQMITASHQDLQKECAVLKNNYKTKKLKCIYIVNSNYSRLSKAMYYSSCCSNSLCFDNLHNSHWCFLSLQIKTHTK